MLMIEISLCIRRFLILGVCRGHSSIGERTRFGFDKILAVASTPTENATAGAPCLALGVARSPGSFEAEAVSRN